MSWSGLTHGEMILANATIEYFQSRFEATSIKAFEEVDPRLGWRPSIHFQRNKNITVIAEVSEDTPYPEIFRLRRAEIIEIQRPVSVYSVCAEEVCLNPDKQAEIQSLQDHGFGLLSVNNQGAVTVRFNCIPLVQHIPETELLEEMQGLPPKIRAEIRDCYDRYKNDSVSGLEGITALVEALVNCAGKRAVSRGWISKTQLGSSSAEILDSLSNLNECKNVRGAIGGVRGYMAEYRNVAHHAPRSKKQAHKKYRDCHNGFREGIRKVRNFREAFKNINVSLTC